MKKVRLAIGAAMPAIGMLAIPTAGAHAATGTNRPVPHHAARTAARPDACGVANSVSQTNGQLTGFIDFDGNCVHLQTATLHRNQTGLTERVRFWTSGKMTKQVFRAGNASGNSTLFGSSPNYYAQEVCQALVANGNHNSVKYGPTCEYTS
jgi:hypothetical protein